MKKYKATSKFMELGIEDSYQHLTVEQYQEFRRGNIVELSDPPEHLIQGEYIEEIKIKKAGDKNVG